MRPGSLVRIARGGHLVGQYGTLSAPYAHGPVPSWVVALDDGRTVAVFASHLEAVDAEAAAVLVRRACRVVAYRGPALTLARVRAALPGGVQRLSRAFVLSQCELAGWTVHAE